MVLRELRQLFYAGLAATYMTVAGCGAATTQATTAQSEPSQEECPPRLLHLAVVEGGIAAFFDSDGNSTQDYMELRLLGANGQPEQHPFLYGWDRNGDGAINGETPGEVRYDPAKDGLNGNEMTPEQFRRFQQGQREHPTPPLESRLRLL